MTYKTHEKVCDHEGCEQSVESHMWARIKADGWFFQKNGAAYCPNHTPEWVAEWRKRKAK